MRLLQLFFYYCILLINDFEMSKKVLYTLEYPIRCSPSILYDFLFNPAAMQEWFADKVDERDTVFSFSWNGSTEKAAVLEASENKFIRFHWINSPKEEYFEFAIEKTEVSSQTILVVKDFAEKKEIADQTRLWEFQVNDLFHRLGN